MGKRISITFAIILLMFTTVDMSTVHAASESVKKNEEKVDKLEREKEKMSEKTRLTEKEVDELIFEINILVDDKEEIEREIEKDEREIKKINREIKAVKDEIQKLQESIDTRTEIVANRLMAIQMKGKISYLDVLFGSEGFIDFITRAQVASKIIKADNEIINDFFHDVDIVEKKLSEVEKLKEDAEDVKKENLNKKKKLEKNIEKTKKQKKALNKEIEETEKSMKEIKKSQDELIEKINKELGMKVGLGKGKLEWPTVSATYVSSGIGMRTHPKTGEKGTFHKGIDIARNDKSVSPPIYAAEDGVVTEAHRTSSYGLMVKIKHDNGIETLYAHLSSLKVEVGDEVRRGQPIGIMGTTGMSTGVHLHFEVYEGGKLQNPLRYVK